MVDGREASPREWDLGEILAPVAKGTTRVPFALVLLNTPIPRDHWRAFLRLWRHASFRVCADGGANRLLDSVGTGAWSGSSDLPLPNQICGDLDSLREDVRDFFVQRVGGRAHTGRAGRAQAVAVCNRPAEVDSDRGGRRSQAQISRVPTRYFWRHERTLGPDDAYPARIVAACTGRQSRAHDYGAG